MAILVKTYRLIIKLILGALLLAIVFFLIGVGILFFKQERIINEIRDELNRYPDISVKYDGIKVNTLENFPHFSYSFSKLSVTIYAQSHPDTIFTAKNFAITISPFKLLNGKVEIKRFNAKGVTIAWKTNFPKELWENSKSNSSNSVDILISNLTLKDFDVQILDSSGKILVNGIGSDLSINLKSKPQGLSLRVRSELSNLLLGDWIISSRPFQLNFDVENEYSNLYINNIYAIIKSIYLTGSGIYNYDTETSSFRITTNRFLSQDLTIFPYLDFTKQLNGKISCEAYIKAVSDFDRIDTLTLHYNSDKVKWVSQKNSVIVSNLEGYTLLTNNFSQHQSFVSRAEVEMDNTKLNLTAKVKGYDNMVVLAKGSLSKDLLIEGLPIEIETKGQFKSLFTYSTTTSAINPIFIDSELDFYSKQKPFSKSKISAKGNIIVNNNLNITGQVKIDTTDLDFRVEQRDVLNAYKTMNFNPEISISGNYLNCNEVIELLSGEKQDSSANNAYFYNSSFKLNFSRAIYNNLQMEGLKAFGKLKSDTLTVEYFSADCFDGNISGKFISYANSFRSNLWVNNISIENVFQNFKNWGQKYITSENLSGRFKGIIDFQVQTNPKGEVDMNSLKLTSDIQVVKGKLRGMDKIKKLSKWLNLDQVNVIEFDTLRNRISIDKKKIIIPNMDVKSNVILMNISGVHTFENSYEYLVRINVSNLLKRIFIISDNTDIHTSTNGYFNLYLKLYGKYDSYSIDWVNKKSFDAKSYITSQSDTVLLQNSSESQNARQSELNNNSNFRLEWDEVIDTLKNE